MKKILLLVAIAAIAAGCSRGNKSEIGPRETVETFYKAICSGDFNGAEALCQKPGMDEYVNTLRTEWEKTDSATVAIVSDILSKVIITITNEEKDGQTRTIFYNLSYSDGNNKEKIATLRKEEEGWKIVAITDKH